MLFREPRSASAHPVVLQRRSSLRSGPLPHQLTISRPYSAAVPTLPVQTVPSVVRPKQLSALAGVAVAIAATTAGSAAIAGSVVESVAAALRWRPSETARPLR